MLRKVFTWIAIILMIIGSLNWLLIGLFDFNLVTFITFGSALLSSIIYILVGISALWMIIYLATLGAVKEDRYGVTGHNSGAKRESYGRSDNRYNEFEHDRRADRRSGSGWNGDFRNY